KHLPHLWDLCLNEITVRSAKHILKGILRDIEDHDIGAAVSHSSIVSLETIKLLEEKPALPRIKRRINLSPRRISGKLLRRKVCHRI
ncbi:hypothetical protein AALP_AAs46735U000100, partial [Arabis alpina]